MARARTGAIVPHAPLLLTDALGSRVDPAVERVRAASREVASGTAGTLVVISPHARATGVYLSTRGDLRSFGVPRAHATCDVDEAAATDLARLWGRPTLDVPLDHGIVVPLALLSTSAPVIAIGLSEEEAEMDKAAATLSDALRALELDEMSVVASVNTGSGVTSRGPSSELADGPASEEEIAVVASRDLGGLGEVASRLAVHGRSCALGPLLVLAHLFDGVPLEVLAHEWPFGVGYLVGRTEEVS